MIEAKQAPLAVEQNTDCVEAQIMRAWPRWMFAKEGCSQAAHLAALALV